MTESSRTRSDSLEAAASQQDRKRPRLDSGHNDRLPSEEALADSAFPQETHPPRSPEHRPAGVACPSKSSFPSPPRMEPSSNGSLSKVTINTRSASGNDESETVKSAVEQHHEISTPLESPGSASSPEMAAPQPPPDSISIHSSSSQSPEIQIAVVEDIGQDPTETNWTPVTRLTDSVLLQEQTNPHYVSRTFPFAQQTPAGFVHVILIDMGKIFLQGGERDGLIFIQLKEWLVTFLEIHPQITQRLVNEEKSFWEEFPDAVNSLLRRFIDVPTEARPTDLEEFFVAYGRLTIRFLELDIQLMNQCQAMGTAETLSELYSRPYLPTLSLVLQYREVPFYNLLASRGFNVGDLVSSICDRLSHGSEEILPVLTSFVQQLGYVLPRKPVLTTTFVQALAISSALARSGVERTSLHTVDRLARSPVIQKINQQVLLFCMKADDALQSAISKQSPWLTIENSPDILRLMSQTFHSASEQDAGIAAQLATYTTDQIPQTSHQDLSEIIAYAWKFKTFRKYITAGRMELRVYGMDSMQTDLVQVWKCHAQYNSDSLGVPLVRFLVQFLRETKMVQYIVGVDSHPQLISRSGNVVGFLVVTGTYCDDDSDTIWCTVKESQDPRTVSEVLNMLKSIFGIHNLPTLMHLCHKLLELPVMRYDIKMVEYADALLHHIRDKALGQTQLDKHLEATPFKVCVRLIRDVIASQTCSSDQKCRLPSWAAENLVHLLAFSIDSEDKRHLWEQCVQDIAQKTSFATGSMRALQAWLEVRPDLEVPKLTCDFDFTRLLIEELVDCLNRTQADDSSRTFMQIILPTRLRLLTLVAQYAPDTVTEELMEILWSDVLTSRVLDADLRNMAWDVFSKVAIYCTKPNSMVYRLMAVYLPKLDAENLNERILHFAENSVLYEMRIHEQHGEEDQGVVSIPGINRVWRFVMECPTGTVENEATNWIIKQYLDHDTVVRCPRRVVEATHLSLLERGLSEVFSAASKLKLFVDGTNNGQDEPMAAIGPEEEVKVEELRFTRSLLFLRQFLSGVKCRPRYSPPLSVEPRLPGKPFQDRGEQVIVNYQVVPIPGRDMSSLAKQLSIGELNTVDELAKYLSDLTGFTQLTGISGGQKIDLIGNRMTIKDSTVGINMLLVKKVPDTPENKPVSSIRAASSMDSHIMEHFNQLYDLLELEEHLSKEVYAFLDLFPPQPCITDLITTKKASVPTLLPTGKPYKLLYGLNALRLCVEDEALGSAPDEDFMVFSVSSIISVLRRAETTEMNKVVRLSINNELVDCLLLALRAQVSLATSQSYFSSSDGLADRLVTLIFAAMEKDIIEGSRIPAHVLVGQPFAALVESALHNTGVETEMSSNDHVRTLIQLTLVEDARAEVRKAVADVIFGLTGQPSTKPAFQKSADSRSARSRFPIQKIEKLLNILWKSLVKILPSSYAYPSTSQQIFDVSLAVLRSIAKTMTSTELTGCFQQWGNLLIDYDHREIVGKPKDDYVVSGFSKLLGEAFLSVQTLQLYVATGQLAQSIFDTFLYPAPFSMATSTAKQRIPLLKDTIREDLYNLVLSFIKDKADYNSIVERLDGLVTKETFPGFAPHIQSERQALRSEIGYAGLRNLSNTCYLNSLFSQLFMNLRFREFIFAVDPGRTGRTDQSVVREMSRLFASMQNRWDKYVDTTDVVASIETYDNEQIDVSVQMDVDEFFNLLFDRLEGQISNPEDKNTFRSLYGGQLVQQIKSRECDHISERLEPFSAIQCEIKGKMTLEDSLRAYVEGEVMQGDNKYSCTSCNRHVDAIKRACLKDIPDHLIFNLKRFDFDITTMTRCKVNDEFRFPESIDMAPYNLESLSNPEQPAPPDMFELVGILVHSGTAESGHYYSYIRERPTSRTAFNSWVQFNDTDVSAFDFQRIADCCFGGVELASTLPLSKAHNAYMLFYQRLSSIKQFKATYGNHDSANPVRLPFRLTLGEEIEVRNQGAIRSYCLQDPSHARFMRLMLGQMQWGTNLQCSDDHTTENKMIQHSLDYIQQISCRFKEMPEFDATCSLLQDYVPKCFNCALQVASFFADTDFEKDDSRKESVLRSAVLRNPNTSVRRSFASMLCEALRTMKQGARDKDLTPEEAKTRDTHYREVYTSCIGNLAEPWSDMHKLGRAWNDYFDLLSRLTSFGVWEAGIVLQCGFLEKIAEIIWADARHDPMELRNRYASYLNFREKGRIFGLSGLIAFFSTILEFVQFNARCEADGLRLPDQDGFYELSSYEAQLLFPLKLSPKHKPSLEWMRRIVMTKQNPNAVTKIVSSLLQEPVLALPLKVTLAAGLATETVGDAIAFLSPTVTFCKFCKNTTLVQLLVKEALNGVDTIGSSFGKEHLDFIIELVGLENEAAGLTKNEFFTMVFRNLKAWAPTLLLFPDDTHHDVRGDAVLFLREHLFNPLEEADSDTIQGDTLVKYARSLAKSCVLYIQQNHLPRSGKQVARVEMGQAHHVSRVINHVCEHFFASGDAADDHFVAEAMTTLEHLQAFTDEVAEGASEDWPDNDSVPASDSDNQDFQDWTETT